jgi:hypothetical protein
MNARLDSWTKGVAPKKNHTWTHSEYRRISSLRKKKYKSSDIANIMDISINQVHNAFMHLKAAMKNECRRCGKALTGEEKYLNNRHDRSIAGICNTCREEEREYKRQKRERALSLGLCGKCYTEPVKFGYTACPVCLSATHRRRNKEGLCAACGVNPIRKIPKQKSKKRTPSLCQACTDESRNKQSTKV